MVSQNDESGIDNSVYGKKSDDIKTPSIKDKISELAKGQIFGVLCTQYDGQPYGSMIGFAFSDDLKNAVFATPRATRKYHNLINCRNVAVLVNDREKYPDDLMKIQAFTATGRAEEITDEKSDNVWKKLLVERQSYLAKFVDSPTTALFRIQVAKYFYVCSFQEVREWNPND